MQAVSLSATKHLTGTHVSPPDFQSAFPLHLPTVHTVSAANVAIGDLVQPPTQLHLLLSR